MNKNMIVALAAMLLYGNALLSAVTMVNNKTELSSMLAKNRPSVLYYSTSICGPCRIISPLYEQLSQDPEFSDILFLKLQIDTMADGNTMAVRSVPTFKFASNGSVNESLTFSGYSEQTIQRIKDKIAMLKGSAPAPAAKPMVAPVPTQQKPEHPSLPVTPPAQSTQMPSTNGTKVIAPQPVIKEPLKAHPLAQQQTIPSIPSQAVMDKTVVHHEPTAPVKVTPQPMKIQPDVQPSKLTPVTCPYAQPSNGVRGSKIKAMRRQVRRPRQRMKTYNR